MNSELLVIEGLTKVYRTGSEDLTVFENVSFRVQESTLVVISGESGSGKTTLLNLIGGLDSATSGRILFQGRDITGRSEGELMEYRSRCLGFVFQFHYLLKDFTALENVLLPATIAGLPPPVALRRAEDLLAQVGLQSRRSHYPVELSGGERQRVAVARALMNDPSLILADEPTGNLDESNSKLVQELLFALVAEARKTMILVTHAAELSRAGDAHYLLEHRGMRRL